ncbi:MAG: 2Fe-2S iron-sulfur cluster-binding protein [Bacteroidota bacterium]
MAKITFITSDGEIITLEATSGTLMELARDNSVKGIDADCGGVCSCATCHVHVEPSYFEKVPDAAEIEKDMLEFEDNATEFSRLSCQVKITEDLDGATLKVAN